MMARIARAFRAEWVKLVHRPLLWVAVALALVLGVGGTALWERVSRRAAQLEGGAALPADGTGGGAARTNGFLVYADALSAGLFIGSLFLVMIAGIIVAEEHELGTAKVLFSKPLRRGEIVTAKALVLVALALALVALVAGAAALAGALFGYGDIVDPQFPDVVHRTEADMIEHAAIATALVLPPLIATLLFAFMVSALSEQSGIAVGLTFAALFASAAGTWLSSTAEPFLVTSYYRFPTRTLQMLASAISTKAWREQWFGNGPPKVLLELAVCLATAVVAYGVATVSIARRPILVFLVAAGLALGAGGAAAPAAAAGEHKIAFAVHEIEAPGQVEDVDVVDIDMDGKEDLVVFLTRGRKGPAPERYIAIFYQRPASRDYARTPDQTVEVPAGAAVRFVADVDPRGGGKELGFLGPFGAFCLTAKDRRFASAPVKLFEDDGFFDIPSGYQCPDWSSLVRDVSGDRLPDILFLRKGDATLWIQDPERRTFARTAVFPLEYKQTFGPRIETLLLGRFISFYGQLARPVIADVDANALGDVVTFRNRSIETYLQRIGPERFKRDPDRRMPLRVVSEDATRSDDEFNNVRTALHDVDGDGLTDLVVYRNVGKVSLFESMRTQIIFYRGTRNGWDEARPAQILNLKGISIDPALIDIERDGKTDLVVSSLRTDLITNAVRAIFSSVTVTYYVFRWDEEKRCWSETADFSRDFTIDVKRLEGSGTIPFAYFWGDYDGDGVQDLLSLEEENELGIYPGEATSSWWSGDSLDFPASEKRTVKVETSNSLHIQDLNGDGKADVTLWYRGQNDKDRGTIRLVVSK